VKPPASEYYLTSKLNKEDLGALEELFYFNPNQWKLRESVEAAVSQFGTPRITNCDGTLRMVLPDIGEAQTLYLYKTGPKQILTGVVVYIREEHLLRVLFWALHPDYTLGSQPESYLLLEMVDALKKTSKRIVGIEMISFRFGSREHRLRI
jgi:hypothetical protein